MSDPSAFDQAVADLKASLGDIADPTAARMIADAIATIEEWHEASLEVTPNPDVPAVEPAQPTAEEPDKADKPNAEDQTTEPTTPDTTVSPDSPSVNPVA